MRNPWTLLTPKAKYLLFRCLAFLIAAGLPAIECWELFRFSGEPITLTIGGGIGIGGFIAASIALIVFNQQVIRTVRKWIGLSGFVLPGLLYLILLVLEKGQELIPKFRAIAWYWMIGAIIGLVLSCIAIQFWGGGLINYGSEPAAAAADDGNGENHS